MKRPPPEKVALFLRHHREELARIWRAASQARAARASSTSPRPASWTPALRPTPRKLKRSDAPLRARTAFASRYVAWLFIVPPYRGGGWQTTAAKRGVSGSS